MEFNSNSKRLLKVLIVLIIMYIVELVYLHYTNIIMKVDGRDITKTQFNEVFEKNANTSGFLNLGIDIKKDKKSALYTLIKDKTVDDLLKQALIDEEIEKRNIKASEEEINNEVQKTIDQYGSKENFNKALKNKETSISQFKKDLRANIKKRKLADSISKINVTDADVKNYYNKNIMQFSQPEKVRASHILISASPKAIAQKVKSSPENQGLNDKEIQDKVNKELAEKQAKAKEILAKLKQNPKLFTNLVKENSDDKSTSNNSGDLGYFAQKELTEPFASVLFKLKLNIISDLVKSPYGYHIFMITEKTKAIKAPIEKVKNQIISILEQEQQDKILDNFAESLKKKAKVEYKNPEYKPKTTISEK